MDKAKWDGDDGWDPFTDPDEKRHFLSVLDSFRQYRRSAHLNTTHVRRQNFYALPTDQWTLLSKPPFYLLDNLSKVDDAIDVNADVAEAIVSASLLNFGPFAESAHDSSTSSDSSDSNGTTTKLDLDKARSTIHQLYRDWSAEGAVERLPVYKPIFEDLARADGAVAETERHNFKILVPGAGLGRLVVELCRAGYNVEGNELSYHQSLTSSFILNNTTRMNEWAICPWAVSFSNHHSRENQLREVTIPDIHPGSLLSSGSMNMTMGDFCEVYKRPGRKEIFDAVVTLFFIDTTPNLITYIETVQNCLKPNGIWINIGPLLWHFETNRNPGKRCPAGDEPSEGKRGDNVDIGASGSFELSEDEVVKLVEMLGFEMMLHEANTIKTGYMQNPRSMLLNVYKPVHWVARKLGDS